MYQKSLFSNVVFDSYLRRQKFDLTDSVNFSPYFSIIYVKCPCSLRLRCYRFHVHSQRLRGHAHFTNKKFVKLDSS